MGNQSRYSKDGAYANRIGMSLRMIRKRGGYEKLHAMTPEAQKVMMGEHEYGSRGILKGGGLRARGMKGHWDLHPTRFGPQAIIEGRIRAILRERGLLEGLRWNASTGEV